jgi:hypothetical protein
MNVGGKFRRPVLVRRIPVPDAATEGLIPDCVTFQSCDGRRLIADGPAPVPWDCGCRSGCSSIDGQLGDIDHRLVGARDSRCRRDESAAVVHDHEFCFGKMLHGLNRGANPGSSP